MDTQLGEIVDAGNGENNVRRGVMGTVVLLSSHQVKV
jgi:hypothetical protein